MSVLIKGIQMPKNEWTDVRLHYDGSVTMPTGNRPYYKLLTTVEIPTPHGRLIDASEKIRVQIYDDMTEDYHMVDMTIDDLLSQGWIEANAPTVIEAEDGEA